MTGDDDAGHWCARFDLAASDPTMLLLQTRTRVYGMVKHATETVRPGQNFNGIAFETMAARGSGWLILRGDRLMIQNILDDKGRS